MSKAANPSRTRCGMGARVPISVPSSEYMRARSVQSFESVAIHALEWIGSVHLIGKESNLLEEVEAGQVHDLQDAYTEYPNARREREAWLRDAVPKLKALSLKELQNRTGLSPATLKAVRAGRMPHAKNRVKILVALCGADKRVQDLTLGCRIWPHSEAEVRNLKRPEAAVLIAAIMLTPWAAAAHSRPQTAVAARSAFSMFLPDCVGKPQMRPATVIITCADGYTLVTHLRWEGWGEPISVALGVLKENTCRPDCADSHTWISRAVAVVASGVQRCPNGDLAYLNILYIDPSSRAYTGSTVYRCSPEP